MKSFVLITILLRASFLLHAQDKNLTCNEIHSGIFYFYPKNIADKFLEVRDEDILTERNSANGDSTIWKIDWDDDCTYSLKYISGNVKFPTETEKLLKKHKFVYKILRITSDYYTFNGYLDKTSNLPIQSDTMRLHEKLKNVDTKLFQQIYDVPPFSKTQFTDTSKYALLYIYRPKKITNSLGNYLVYFADKFICVGKNNSGYIFKIFKEGQFEVKSQLYQDVSSTLLNIKYGNIYYVKSMIHWGITSRLYNFKLEMLLVDSTIGETEFKDVRFQH